MQQDKPEILLPIDQYSAATCPIEMLFQDTVLASGTAFLWRADRHYLITNWHNVTGKDPFTGGHLSNHAGEPDSMRVYFCEPMPSMSRHMVTFRLRDENGLPNWMVHRQHGNRVDVVALPINIGEEAEPNPINEMASLDMDLRVGMDVFVLGYPLGIGVTALPVWKRASVASEPNLIVTQQLYLFLDTATRPGMSGSPVIQRTWGAHSTKNGSQFGGQATRFVGVYSGRFGPADSDVQLGLMWPAKFIEEIVREGVRDNPI